MTIATTYGNRPLQCSAISDTYNLQDGYSCELYSHPDIWCNPVLFRMIEYPISIMFAAGLFTPINWGSLKTEENLYLGIGFNIIYSNS